MAHFISTWKRIHVPFYSIKKRIKTNNTVINERKDHRSLLNMSFKKFHTLTLDNFLGPKENLIMAAKIANLTLINLPPFKGIKILAEYLRGHQSDFQSTYQS